MALLLWSWGFSPRDALAEPPPARTLPSTADLDGTVLALGPLGSAVVHDAGEGGWDGSFGGEVVLARVRERELLSAAGLAVGGARFVDVERGHLFAELVAGSNRPFGITVGIAAGVTLEVDEVRPARWGWQAGMWAYVGVAPYVRVGHIDQTGMFAEAGLRIPLPAIRWR